MLIYYAYDNQGVDRIILVEDDLAKEIIRRILKKESMMNPLVELKS